MIGVLGLALMSASVLLLFYVARRRNSPNPPSWSQWGVTVHTTLVTFLCGSLFGASLIAFPFLRKSASGIGLLELTMAVAIAAATVVLWKLIGRIPKTTAPANTDLPTPPAAEGTSKRHAA